MTFNIDEAIDGLLPWELSLIMQGEPRVTRRPSVAEFGKLLRMKDLTDDEGGKLLAGLFDPPIPVGDLLAMGNPTIIAVLVAYLTYFRSRALKNPMAIATQVRAAIAAAKTKDSVQA